MLGVLWGERQTDYWRSFVKSFWLFWGFDALITLVVLYFFVIGLIDGSVSSFNMGLWLLILLAVGGVMLGSLWLQSVGHRRPAIGVLLILAWPGLMCLLFFLAVLILHPRWN
jgi:hypothetical protein